MSNTVTYSPGHYRYIPGVFQYSAGVAAEPGYRIERTRFSRPIPLSEGFRRIAEFLDLIDRPLAAFCACELRSPAPFSEADFRVFNEEYVANLSKFDIFDGANNPVARANVCPKVDPPATPSFYAFSYTVPDASAAPSFVVSGSGEAPEGKSNYKDHVISRGDVSLQGLRKKAQWVLREMENRMEALGVGWPETTAVQVYTVHDIYPFIEQEIIRRGAMRSGLTWHFNRPPVVDLEYEMDCRGVSFERIVKV